MSDVFAPLQRLEESPAGLHPDEVRRLGDRHRRRRTTTRLAVAAAAVLAVVAGGIALTDLPGSDTGADPARPMPSVDGDRAVDRTTPERLIPEDFPLTTGLPASAGYPDGSGADTVVPLSLVAPTCGAEYESIGRPLDRLLLAGTNNVFQGVRDLVVYDSARQARRAAGELRRVLEDCPREDLAGTTAVATVQDLDLGDRSWRAVREYRSGGAGTATSAHVWFVVQQGPALLVSAQMVEDEPATALGSAATDLQGDLDDYLDDYRRTQVEPMVEALCGIVTVC